MRVSVGEKRREQRESTNRALRHTHTHTCACTWYEAEYTCDLVCGGRVVAEKLGERVAYHPRLLDGLLYDTPGPALLQGCELQCLPVLSYRSDAEYAMVPWYHGTRGGETEERSVCAALDQLALDQLRVHVMPLPSGARLTIRLLV